jgi:hypothetical protein
LRNPKNCHKKKIDLISITRLENTNWIFYKCLETELAGLLIADGNLLSKNFLSGIYLLSAFPLATYNSNKNTDWIFIADFPTSSSVGTLNVDITFHRQFCWKCLNFM